MLVLEFLELLLDALPLELECLSRANRGGELFGRSLEIRFSTGEGSNSRRVVLSKLLELNF